MKRIISLMLVVLLLAMPFSTVTFASGATMTIANGVEISAGETAVVSFVLSGGVDVKTYSVKDITYDIDNLELVSGEVVKIGDPTIAKFMDGALAVTYEDYQATCEGTVLNVTFKAKETATFGKYEISCTSQVNKADITVVKGSLVIPGPSLTVAKDVVVKPGETAEVLVSLDNNEIPVKTYSVKDITYDADNLELVSGEVVKIGDPTIAKFMDGALAVTYEDYQATCAGNVLKLTFKAKETAVEATYTISCTSQVNKTDIEVIDGSIIVRKETVVEDWTAVDAVIGNYTYGTAEPFALPASGTVTIDTVPYTGTYSIKEDLAVIPAGENKTVTVVLTINDGTKDRTFEKAYPVTVNKANYDMSKITAAPQTATFTGEAIDYDYAKNVTMPADVTVTDVVYSSVPTKDVGDYTATIKFETSNPNYNNPIDITVDHKITKARATTVRDTFAYTLSADDATNTDAAALKAGLYLPASVKVNFEGAAVVVEPLTEEVDVTWSDANKDFNVKGETYTYTATSFTSDNLDVTGLTLTATVTVTPVTAVLDVANITKIFSKAEVEAAADLAALGIPASADLEVGADLGTLNLVYDKTIEDVKADAANVTDGHDEVVTINLDVEASLEEAGKSYLTVGNDSIITLTITNKKEAEYADLAELNTELNITYGETLPAINVPEWTPKNDDDVKDDAVTHTITYMGKGDTVYAESETAPTAAGTYTVKVTLNSEIYSAVAEMDFTIAKKPITLTVRSESRAYGEENPTFVLTEATPEDLGLTFACAATATTNVGDYDITVEATNPNYKYTYNKGTLTITEAAVTGAPVISGDAVVGGTLTATFANEQITTFQWYVGGEAVVDVTSAYYVPVIADSNKAITVKAVAGVDNTNYTGESDASTAVTVDKYEIKGEITITGDFDRGNEITADVASIDGYDVIGAFNYVWAINGTPAEGGNASTFIVPQDTHKGDVVTVTVTPASADFTGSITATAGTVGYRTLTGSLVLNEDIPAEGDAKGLVITAEPGVNAGPEGYDIVWIVGTTEVIGETTYTISEADYGKAISAKLVGKGDYKGEVTTEDFIDVPAIAPSNVVITTDVTKNSIDVEVTANANGAAITEYALTLKDGEGNVVEEATATIAEGKGTYTFANLDSGKTYTIEAVAKNTKGSDDASAEATTKKPSSTLSPVTGTATGTPTTPTTPPADETPSTGETETPSTGETETPATPETTITVPEADVVVESKTETATVPAADLADASVVAATVKTESGATVEVTVDVAEKAVDSLTVSADKADAEVTGKAADGIVGDAIEVKVDAKSGDAAVAVDATIAIDVEAQAYAYAVDELGNTVRLDSAYDAETGKLLVAGVADGTVVAVSTTAPVDFADTEDRWSHKEVARAVDLGIVNGRAANAYAPAELLTRGETNKIKMNLAQALKLDIPVNADVKIDTAPSHWAYESDLWAAQTGITTGTGTNEDGAIVISGGDNVVRQDYLTLLARMIKLAIGDVTVEGTGVEFADAEHVADYAADSIKLLSSIGILKGSEGADGVYANPKANITREEAAALSNRAYEFVKVLKTAK